MLLALDLLTKHLLRACINLFFCLQALTQKRKYLFGQLIILYRTYTTKPLFELQYTLLEDALKVQFKMVVPDVGLYWIAPTRVCNIYSFISYNLNHLFNVHN